MKWLVEHTMVCQACATRDMVMRQLQKQHEKDKPSPHAPMWHDGRVVSVRPAGEADLRAAAKGQRATVTRV